MLFYTAEDPAGGTLLCATISDLTTRMRDTLWAPGCSYILASGTLAVGSDFSRFKTQAGLQDNWRVVKSVSPSPFDYRANCLLYLPQLPPRFGSEAYYDETTDEIAGLLTAASGHALVLFTSYAAMSAVKIRLQERKLPYPIFTLGRNAPPVMERFRKTPGAVLLATGAAWEGFDFPGGLRVPADHSSSAVRVSGCAQRKGTRGICFPPSIHSERGSAGDADQAETGLWPGDPYRERHLCCCDFR